MEIPNLATQLPVNNDQTTSAISLKIIAGVVILAIVAGFWLSRFFPNSTTATSSSSSSSPITSIDTVSNSDDLVVGKTYGNVEKTFKDTATGVLEKGNINGEGTHILIREGGSTQRASLTSSAVDLDLFVGKKVEIKGETNASNKTSWLLDVGSIKILQ